MTPERQPWSAHLSLSIPVAMGYVPLGAVFGFLFMQAGAEWWMPLLASLWLYAGAAQFMMVPLLAAGASLGALALATFVVNFRHVFYGLSLLKRRPRTWWARAYQSFSLTDETYAVLTTLPEQTPTAHLLSLAALNQMWWVLGTLMGVALGASAQLSFAGLGFALTALFAVLLVEQLRTHRRWGGALLAAAIYLSLRVWWPQQALMASMAAVALLGAWWPHAARAGARHEHGRS